MIARFSEDSHKLFPVLTLRRCVNSFCFFLGGLGIIASLREMSFEFCVETYAQQGSEGTENR